MSGGGLDCTHYEHSRAEKSIAKQPHTIRSYDSDNEEIKDVFARKEYP